MRDILQQHRLACPRRCNDKAALAFSDRCNQIDNPGRSVTDRRVFDFHLQPFVRIKRGQVVEVNLVPGFLGIVEIDPGHLRHAKVTLCLARCSDIPFNRIAGPQRELPQYLGRDIDIVRPRQIVRLFRPKEAKAILQNFQYPVAANLPAFLGMFLQDREHHLALAHRRRILDLPLFCHRQKIGRRLSFKIGKVQSLIGHENARADR